MTPFEAIEAELARVQARVAELQAAEADLETAKRVLLSLSLNGAPATERQRVKLVAVESERTPVDIKVNRKRGVNPWTDEEIDVLREHWPRGAEKACVPLLPNRTASAIRNMAYARRFHTLSAPAERDTAAAQPESRAPLGDRRFRENKPPRSFDEQVARVERGEVGIAPAFHAHRAAPDQTLGGVTGEIM